ncbi:MAG: NYN domain-containing protein [bacterium]|nr:NYN domain-containing protein [bacterium]
MKRYALIDVSNTKETTKTVFNFSVDWEKTIMFLKNEKWQCQEVIYYEGRTNDRKFDNLHAKLKSLGYMVRTKTTFFHQNKKRDIKFVCKKCSKENSFEEYKFNCLQCSQEKIIDLNNKGTHPKANFDVELTVDALSFAGPDVTIILFTGDGDFRYLAEKLVEAGATVIFVSTYHETLKDKRKRFSTRLKGLLFLEEQRATRLKEKPRVRFLEIDNFRNLISKNEEKENAAKRDVSE